MINSFTNTIMMEDIQSPNFQALHKFTRKIKTDLAKNNRQVKMAHVHIIYSCDRGTKYVDTNTLISLNNHPFAKLTLIEKEWLNANDFFVEFQTGYNKFSFDVEANTLIIENNNHSKMGSYYIVKIREL